MTEIIALTSVEWDIVC